MFGIVFIIVLYLVIGLLFVILRIGNVFYEIGFKLFMLEGVGFIFLIFFIIIFFSIICFFLLNFVKIVDIVGKILILIKLIFIGILVIVVFIYLIGDM